MTSAENLLELACNRIADLETPAYVKNSELRYLAVNEAYARFFGREISDFIGRRTHDILDRPDQEEREDKERRALVFGTEENAICFDAAGTAYAHVQVESFMPAEDRAYVLGIFTDNGRPLAVNSTDRNGTSKADAEVLHREITEMKQREEELQRLLERAEAADRAKSEFLANISHEIRAPVNGVLDTAGLLARTDLDTRQKAFVDIIVKSGNVLLTIIDDILDVSKIDADPEPLPVELRVLVIDGDEVDRRVICDQLALWGFDGAAAEDGRTGIAIIEAAWELGVDVDAVVLDYHMPEMNGAAVAGVLKADARFENVPIVFLASTDIAGTEEEFAALNGQAHLVKPVRADLLRSTIVEAVRASRVKRASAAEIVGLQAGSGTCALEPEALPLGEPQKPLFVDVLVAEDNEVNQIVFTQILQGTGLSFMVVNNGQEAVNAWQTHSPRTIMMDISMPVMNGHDATRAIRERERGQGHRVPIIGLTAHALEADRELYLAAGMDDTMSKPVSPELLEEKIQFWLGKDEQPAAQTLSFGIKA